MLDAPQKSRNPEPEKPAGPENPWRQYGRYSQLALTLPACVIVGLAAGAALDHWLHTAWLTLAGLLVGCVAGFTELIRGFLKANKET